MKRKALTLITLLLTPYIQSNIDITTLSDWDINDFDEHTLLVQRVQILRQLGSLY